MGYLVLMYRRSRLQLDVHISMPIVYNTYTAAAGIGRY